MAKKPAAKPLYLTPHDHAFGSGPVFMKPASLEAARDQFPRPEDGELLWRVFEAFEDSAIVGERLRLSLNARLVSKNAQKRVTIGDDCAIRGMIRCEKGGSVTIGSTVYIGDGTIINAQSAISIGDFTLLAHGVQIFDNNSHPVDALEREAHFKSILGLPHDQGFHVASRPVTIGRRSWIGFNAAIMKGVVIGDEGIVAAGAIVVHDVPAKAVVAGNPAQIVKQFDGAVAQSRAATLRRFRWARRAVMRLAGKARGIRV